MATFRIMAVCTANMNRSPMAAALLRSGGPVVGLNTQVASSGTNAIGGPADPHAISAMADRGIDISPHRAHLMTDIDIAASDLILAMAGEHVLEIVGRVPDALAKTFTIKEFVKLATAAGPNPNRADPVGYLSLLDHPRRRDQLIRRSRRDDIADPLGQGRRAFQRTADELEALVWAAVDLLAGYERRDI